ncbi:MAG: T9SS type A sorting domain-containing protein [Crocinitomicaceae bacterium]|nr:T9SS type A sorting domain-containing protein [Crocinitomicaceae bacterium]
MGCKGSAEFFVNGNSLPYALNSNSTDASCSMNNGVIDYDIYGGSGTFTYAWNSGETTQDIMSAYSGTYTCLVTDAVTGCYFEYSHDVFSSGGPGAYLDFVKQPTCGNADGSIDLTTYIFSAPITGISWSSGHTTEDLANIPEGEYEISVTAQDGCIFNHTIKLENQKPEHPEICMLTVDTSLIYNVVVWEKDITQPNIDGFNIYRETSTYGNFELVSSRPYALESMFQDNDASPVDRSWRYYITAYDDCGNESVYGVVHKTIHAVATTVNSTDYTIHWDNYEGMVYSDVNVHRFDSTNGWVTIASNISFGTNAFPDTPPVLTGLDYLVEFNLADPCQSAKVQDHNSSRSNKSSSVFDPGNSTVQIQDNELGAITCYPNPSEDMFVIHVDQFDLVTNYQIVDLNGNLIQSGLLTSNNTAVDVADVASGIYLVKISSENNILTIKMVVQ